MTDEQIIEHCLVSVAEYHPPCRVPDGIWAFTDRTLRSLLQMAIESKEEEVSELKQRAEILRRSSLGWEQRWNALAKAAKWVSDCWGRKEDTWIRADMDEAVRELRRVTPRPSPMACECSTWVRECPSEAELQQHHRHCVWAE